MKIVLTGASGLVATDVADYIINNTDHQLLLVDRRPPANPIQNPRVEYLTTDLLQFPNFLEAVKGADGIIHLAGIPNPIDVHPAISHNTNVSLSFNALQAAHEAGVGHIVLASSVNAIGGVYSPDTKYDYFPLDEKHPHRGKDAYSLAKQIVEVQADAFARANPDMTIASFRFHHVVPQKKKLGHIVARAKRDLWGYVLDKAAGAACVKALEAPWKGHEVIYIVGDEHCAEGYHVEHLIKEYYPDAEIRGSLKPGQALYSTEKAEKLLGWRHEDFRPPGVVEGVIRDDPYLMATEPKEPEVAKPPQTESAPKENGVLV